MNSAGYEGFEKYNRIFEGDCRMKPGKSQRLSFVGEGLTDASRLFLTGETDIFYMWKSESDYQMLYRRIDDSLSSSEAETDRYALDLSGDFAPYPKVAYKKITAPFTLSYLKLETYTDDWRMGISVKARDLVIKGYLRMLVEIRYKREGESVRSVKRDADESFVINIPEGSYSLTELSRDISFDAARFASACFYIEGENYSGEVFLEAPFFKNSDGRNILPPFIPHTLDRPHFNWLGQNLSRVEWPSLRAELNGQVIFDGEFFERCHRRSELEISIPRGLLRTGENELTFTLTSDFRDAPGYNVCEVGLITERDSRVISVPDAVTAGETFFVFVSGKRGDKLSFSSSFVKALSDNVLKRDGTCALPFFTEKVGSDIDFVLDGEACRISRSVIRENDGVITGTGDMIYVDTNRRDVENYLKWYLSSSIGDLLTIRPTYRWSGTRVLNAPLWREVADILSEGNIKYAHMIDGRDLPGCDVNPAVSTLAGDCFLGRQNHEFDGQYTYWGFRDISTDPIAEAFHELFARMYKRSPETVNERYGLPDNLHYHDGKCTAFRRLGISRDMKAGAENFVDMLKRTKCRSGRHTGPATLFKYFYQAGYEWTGAELLYTPTELTASFLRGARDLYGGSVGAHLAVQWSTSPHDTEERYRRYLLSLYVSYIQGIDEINTEEGLWHLEEYYSAHHRFSPACVSHRKIQREFYKYTKTHTRLGKFYTPIAFLSGRYDGFGCFDRNSDVWGIAGMKQSDPEHSWELLRYFYPRSVLDAIYRHDTPSEPLGYYSGTPHGSVDVVPIESGDFSRYKLLVACGYNAATSDDLSAFIGYAERGGTLVIGWPQLSVTTDRDAVVSYDHEYLIGLTPSGKPSFTGDTYMGEPISAATLAGEYETVIKSDTGATLVARYAIGEGSIYFVNAKEYAGAAAVESLYRKTLDILTPAIIKNEHVYAEGDEKIQFTVYERDDGCREIYFISTDWYSIDRDGFGKLRLGNTVYSVPVPFGAPVKVVANSGTAVYPLKAENEVIGISGGEALVQGVGIAQFVILKDGISKSVTVDFSEVGVRKLKLI